MKKNWNFTFLSVFIVGGHSQRIKGPWVIGLKGVRVVRWGGFWHKNAYLRHFWVILGTK